MNNPESQVDKQDTSESGGESQKLAEELKEISDQARAGEISPSEQPVEAQPESQEDQAKKEQLAEVSRKIIDTAKEIIDLGSEIGIDTETRRRLDNTREDLLNIKYSLGESDRIGESIDNMVYSIELYIREGDYTNESASAASKPLENGGGGLLETMLEHTSTARDLDSADEGLDGVNETVSRYITVLDDERLSMESKRDTTVYNLRSHVDNLPYDHPYRNQIVDIFETQLLPTLRNGDKSRDQRIQEAYTQRESISAGLGEMRLVKQEAIK
jgi:hypothetical protein